MLFNEVSPCVRGNYICRSLSLSNCDGCFIIVTLRSDVLRPFQAVFRIGRLAAFAEDTNFNLRHHSGIGHMIQFPAESASALRAGS